MTPRLDLTLTRRALLLHLKHLEADNLQLRSWYLNARRCRRDVPEEADLSEEERSVVREVEEQSRSGTETSVQTREVRRTLPFNAPLLFGNTICSSIDEI